MMLVSLNKGKQHLRMDHDAEDDMITTYIQAASAAVLNYLKSGKDAFLDSTNLDSSGEVEVDSDDEPVGIPFEVQAATLLMLGYLYKNRDNNDGIEGAFGQGTLPMPVTALLSPLRDPACH